MSQHPELRVRDKPSVGSGDRREHVMKEERRGTQTGDRTSSRDTNAAVSPGPARRSNVATAPLSRGVICLTTSRRRAVRNERRGNCRVVQPSCRVVQTTRAAALRDTQRRRIRTRVCAACVTPPVTFLYMAWSPTEEISIVYFGRNHEPLRQTRTIPACVT